MWAKIIQPLTDFYKNLLSQVFSIMFSDQTGKICQYLWPEDIVYLPEFQILIAHSIFLLKYF